jgi:hypothetical protein
MNLAPEPVRTGVLVAAFVTVPLSKPELGAGAVGGYAYTHGYAEPTSPG